MQRPGVALSAGEAAVDGGVQQVVILAAGLGTRAFRLELPTEFRTFEIDQAQTQPSSSALLSEKEG
ncbi:class I SAM-dependent methyltransferase [Psychromicrobium silvestre]|uniref:class I SAM-dependent methyltransferase n=1 Tax=Psychromicrobium silvestre TaxID=1645614 RepID=UPI001C53F14B|nr:class I SAM-dependent methyltransferase [Psychromicrobium silvestre]